MKFFNSIHPPKLFINYKLQFFADIVKIFTTVFDGLLFFRLIIIHLFFILIFLIEKNRHYYFFSFHYLVKIVLNNINDFFQFDID
jgi:hypothetical protein